MTKDELKEKIKAWKSKPSFVYLPCNKKNSYDKQQNIQSTYGLQNR